MASLQTLLPGISTEELSRVSAFTGGMTDDQLHRFATLYGADRKEVSTIFWITLLLGPLGVHQFMLGKTGMGVAYLLTGGLFVIGWVIDIFRAKNLAIDKNTQIAREAAMVVKA